MRPATTLKALAITLAVAGALAFTPAAEAQGLGSSVELHGFGGWAYANTDGNNYLIGTDQGTYDNVAMALNVNAKVSDRLTVVGQFEFQQRPGYADMDRTLDFAFAEWKFSDGFKLRAGRVKHPFGIYGEIFNVGTLRPFYMLPQSIYGPERYTARSVDGLGVTGQKAWESGWGLNYDVYGGRIAGELRNSGVGSEAADLQNGYNSAPFSFDEVLGGRLTVTTPVEGLSFGSSAYRGKAALYLFEEGQRPKEGAVDFQVEYQAEPLLVRAEYGTIFNDPVVRYDTYYVEGAVKVYKGLQLAVRYDRWQGHLKDKTLNEIPWLVQIQKHKDIVLGVNYWFSPNFALKASYHIVNGNRYAQPDDPTAVVGELWDGSFEPDTRMFVLGTQFSF
jgi:hypothetical protein